MFNFGKVHDLQCRVDELEFELKHAEKRIKSYQDEIANMNKERDDKVQADCETATFVIDWKNMDVFSLERMGDHKTAYTVLGHWVKNTDGTKEVHEWKFYCSHEQHEKLAKQFEAVK
jgi:recombinational DNA repair protein RecR